MTNSLKRIQTIDILRALTVALMIFVNDAAGLSNVPDWLGHAAVGADAMYLADIVFSLFLFWVGMSIPLAIDGRKRKGVGDLSVLEHIIKRTAGLLIIGILMVNVSSLSPEKTGMTNNLWAFLMYVGVIASWRTYGKENTLTGRWIGRIIHYAGVGLLVYLILIFRTESNGWLSPKWWGILGLIGWAYFASAVSYLFFRDRFVSLVLIFIGLILYHSLYSVSPWLKEHTGWLSLNAYGGHAALTFAGMMTTLVMKKYRSSTRKFLTIWSGAAALFLALAFISRPIWGIQKNAATPSWVWLSIAVGLVLLILLWRVIEEKDKTAWAAVFKPAGTNTFLAYLLPSLYYHLIWYLGIGYPSWFNHSIGGVIRSIIFTILIIQLTGLLAKMGVRLKL